MIRPKLDASPAPLAARVDDQRGPARQRMTGWHIDAAIEFAARVADPNKLPSKHGDKEKLTDAIRGALNAKNVKYDDGDLRTLLARFYKHLGI